LGGFKICIIENCFFGIFLRLRFAIIDKMDFKKIQELINKREYLFSEHGDEERTKDQLTVGEVEQAILSGEVIDERLEDHRGESRLIAGITQSNKLIHVVIGLRFGLPVIVTVYIPSKEKWIYGKIKKR